MAGQMPILAFFAVKWLPRAPPTDALCTRIASQRCSRSHGPRVLAAFVTLTGPF